MAILHRISINQLLRKTSKVLNFNDKIVVSDHISQLDLFKEPCHLDALTILFVWSGKLEYGVNLKRCVTDSPSILINTPSNIIQFYNADNLEAYALLISSDILRDMPYDLIKRTNSYLPITKYIDAKVPLEKIKELLPFYDLIKYSLANQNSETKSIVMGLLQAFLLTVANFVIKYDKTELEPDQNASRSARNMFEKFMTLLAQYHQHERTVQFYADNMCVTPKYLSMVIKEYSGKSPSDWIGDYVIAEARSLLHYSQLSIQEVSYRLNFPSQSAFGKFFKQKTGVSPLQYIKGEAIDSQLVKTSI